VYVTGCDLGESFVFEKIVAIRSHVRFSSVSDLYVNILLIIDAVFSAVCETERFKTANWQK